MTPPELVTDPWARSGSTAWLFYFGAYGWTTCVVWSPSLESAMAEAWDWVADSHPDLLCDEAVAADYRDAYERLRAEGMSEEDAEEQAQEESETDTTSAGSEGQRILSWEWTVSERPSRDEILGMTIAEHKAAKRGAR